MIAIGLTKRAPDQPRCGLCRNMVEARRAMTAIADNMARATGGYGGVVTDGSSRLTGVIISDNTGPVEVVEMRGGRFSVLPGGEIRT